MKTLTTLVFLLFSIVTIAQVNGINYKALIKDTNGNVVNNTSTTIEFTIYKGTGLFNTYRETHTIFTDNNGILIANIGEGTIVNGMFNSIIWNDDEYFLGVKVDTGDGYVDLGITTFKSVPYAKVAENVKGLEPIDEGNGTGWRLIGKNPGFYGNIGSNAVDISHSTLTDGFRGTTGANAFATGINTIALGEYSFASGFNSHANGNGSISLGRNSIANGNSALSVGFSADAIGNVSISLGRNTESQGDNSFAAGNSTIAISENEVAVGAYNTQYNPATEANRAFVVGNGTNTGASRNDALIVQKDGVILAPSLDVSEIIDNKALITKEYLETNVSGLEALDEGNGIGWRLKGLDPDKFGNIGLGAVNFSENNLTSVDFIGAIGDYSFTAGINTYAIGYASVSMGASQAHGDYATAFGQGQAEGDYSFSAGYSVFARSYGETALGYFNEYYTPSVDGETQPNPTDRLFTIGNGVLAARSNALTILKNGTITAPSFDVSEITDNKALITKEYADQNLQNSGLEALNETNGNGYRLIGNNADNYGNIGGSATDLSTSFFASTTLGATGDYAFASGYETTASGNYSSSFGFQTIASAVYSTSMGYNTNANGFYATSLGLSTNANAYASIALGRYNAGGGSASSWLDEDPLFEVGNGTSNSEKSNAFTILKNGNIGISTTNPVTNLHITNGSGASLNNPSGVGYMILGDVDGPNIVMDNNEIMARNNGSNSNLYLQNEGGRVGIGNVVPDAKLHIQGGNDAGIANGTGYVVIGDLNDQNMVIDQNEIIARVNGANGTLFLNQPGGDVWAGGALVHSSDRRLKKDISELKYGLDEVLNLQPKQYFWKNRKTQKQESFGLIAQEVQNIIGNVVHIAGDEQKTLSISYTELIPVLINAIKEQQQIIDSQKKKYNNLLNRVEALETTESNKIALKAND